MILSIDIIFQYVGQKSEHEFIQEQILQDAVIRDIVSIVRPVPVQNKRPAYGLNKME
jgi:hypothetical protein